LLHLPLIKEAKVSLSPILVLKETHSTMVGIESTHENSGPLGRPGLIHPSGPTTDLYRVRSGHTFTSNDLKNNRFTVIKPEVDPDSIKQQSDEVKKRKDFQEMEKKFRCWLKALPTCKEVVVEYHDYSKFQYSSMTMIKIENDSINVFEKPSWTNLTSIIENGCSGFRKPCSQLSDICNGLAFANCQMALEVVYWQATGNDLLGPWNETIKSPIFKANASELKPNNVSIFGLLALFLLIQFFKFQ
jgi:hypothetical protein